MNTASEFSKLVWLVAFAVVWTTARLEAAVISVIPGDTYAKIESANPGDEVVIAPGTYSFRVYLRACPQNADF